MVLQQNKRNILASKEKPWRLKGRALWLSKGDENMKYFLNFEKYRKNILLFRKFREI
jgi:hypothetical protein